MLVARFSEGGQVVHQRRDGRDGHVLGGERLDDAHLVGHRLDDGGQVGRRRDRGRGAW